jgi:hypothetical protein
MLQNKALITLNSTNGFQKCNNSKKKKKEEEEEIHDTIKNDSVAHTCER